MEMATTVGVREAIASANENFMDTFSQGDAAGMADLYTEDGQVLPPNSDFVMGKEAIQSFWQALIDMGIKEVKLDIGEVEQQNDLAFEVSRFMLAGDEGQVLDQGKYIVVWKEEHGQWKLHRDIFNSSLPAPS
jgi:uncharacterized protein (TIGR02246 family)